MRGRALVAILFVLAACGQPSAPPTVTPVPTILPRSESSSDPQPIVDAVLNEAAGHLGVSTQSLHVDRVEARQWPDSSLGCPQPGLMYSQIVTPGFLVVLSSGSKVLEYHTDTRSNVVLCKES